MVNALTPSKYSLAASSLVLLILTVGATTAGFPNNPVASPSSSPHPRDFAVIPIPNQLVVDPGSAGSSNLTLASIGGFAGTISLSATISAPNGTAAPTVSVTPSSVRLKAGANASSTLTVLTQSTTPIGTYTVTIVAKASKIIHTALVTATVSDFALTLQPSSEALVLGSSRTSFYTVTSLNGFTGTVTMGASNPLVNVGVGFQSQVTVASGGNASGPIFVNVGNTAPLGTFQIVFTATSGSITHMATLTLTITSAPVPDFTLMTSPVSLTIPDGSTGFVNITLSSIAGFTGNVTLTGSVIPAISGGPVAVITRTSVFLSPNVTGTSLLEIFTNSATPTGFYNYTVSGMSGSVFHQVFGSFTVASSTTGDFTVSANPSSLTIPQGSQDRDFLDITSTSGFSGTVNLAAFVAPPGPFLVLANNQVTLAPGGTAQVVLAVFVNTTVPVPAGRYNITVTGSTSSLFHQIIIPVTVTVPLENLVLVSASFQPTNITLQVQNTGSTSAGLVAYSVQDKAGDTWQRTGWSGPTIGPNSTASSILLTIGVSCPSCSYTGTPGAFNQFIPGNVYTIFLTSARNILYKFTATYPSTTREGLLLESYTFTSGTNLTLFIRNLGNISVTFTSYYVKDSSGNQYALTTWAGPTINPNNTAPAVILIGSSCPACTLVGTAFTFTPGFSYTIVIVTARNNQFSFTVIR
ncbi:hypothetical protein E6H31_08415 [Candidatus Bathyarchaeota archaeon]|nr:MAG: hypothetical protein E6H31_08415 [Candidatus Bathyarchaeota archaeon]